jgi:Ca-activated chloride channel family protein
VRFAEEFWLWAVPLLPVLWLLMRAGDRKARRQLELLLGARASIQVEQANPRLRSWQRFLGLAAMFWLLLGLARPQWGAREVSVTQQGSDIVVALDISNSMLAEDVVPNRMERAKAELGGFLDRLQNSRVGLVFFAGAAFVQCPLTLDYGTADIFLAMAGPDMMSEQGTAIGAALKASRELLARGQKKAGDGRFQAILLVTDGEDLEGNWEQEARACRDLGIRVIPVGVGEESGGLIPVQDSQGRPAGFMKDDEGKVVMTRMDLARLEELAAIGGGSSFRLGVDGLAGDRLFAELQRLGRRDLEERRISAYQERFIWPLLLSVLSLVLGLLLRARSGAGWRRPAAGLRRAGGAGVVMLALCSVLAHSAAAALVPPELGEMNKGRQRYESGDYAAALEAFSAALVRAPDDPVIGLAVGESLFQLKRYDEALTEFERVLDLASDPALRAEALYNHGTARLAAGDPAGAAENLREALRLNPDQGDALFNLEVALQRVQEQEQPEQKQDEQKQDEQKQDEQKQDEQKQDEQKKDDQKEEEQEDKDQQQQEQDQQQQQDKPEQDKPEQQQQDQQQKQEQEAKPSESQTESDVEPAELKPEDLTREQQQQILKALDRDEEELKRSVQKRLRGGQPQSGKKW